jgi:hypothetical protein
MRAGVFLGLVAALILGALGGYEYALHYGAPGRHDLFQNSASISQPATAAGAPTPPNAPSPEVRAAAKNMREACAQDIGSLCKDVAPERGGIARCLRSHEAQLSAGCATAWQNLRAARQAARGAEGATGGTPAQ